MRTVAICGAAALLLMTLILSPAVPDAVGAQEMDPAGMDHDSGGHASAASADHGGDHAGGADSDPMEHDHEALMSQVAPGEGEKPVGVEERLGEYVADVRFVDSTGAPVNLRDIADAPTFLLPIYFKCPDVCNLLQSSFAQVLPEVELEPGTEIQVVSLSFDERDTPAVAARAKAQYMAAAQGGFPPDEWHFLTADQKAIDKALGSIGYTVQRQGGLFAHPVAVVVLAPGGKIVRYLYGPGFLPFDITMAATEAQRGITGLSVKRLLSMCYNYDPEGRRYVFSTLRVAGFSIMTFLVLFVGYLVWGGKKRRKD